MLDALLSRGHSVVTTVRSDDKGKSLLASYPNTPRDKLSFIVVPDVAAPGAFSGLESLGLQAVIHVASPVRHPSPDVSFEQH